MVPSRTGTKKQLMMGIFDTGTEIEGLRCAALKLVDR